MEEKNIGNIAFDYYSNTSTYLKTVFDILPKEEVSLKRKALIIEIFNYMLNTLSRDQIAEIVNASLMFNEKLMYEPSEYALIQAKYIYENFLDKMLFDSYNRKKYFDIMNECIKVSSGWYKEASDNSVFYQSNDNAVGNIRVR